MSKFYKSIKHYNYKYEKTGEQAREASLEKRALVPWRRGLSIQQGHNMKLTI